MATACTVPKSQLKCKYCESQNSHNTATCLKKKKAEKEKREGEKGGKTDTTIKGKTTSQDRRDNSSGNNKRDLSQPKDNRSPARFGAPCAQVRVREMGDKPSGNDSDSDEEGEYDTPPETLDSEDNLEEENNKHYMTSPANSNTIQYNTIQ